MRLNHSVSQTSELKVGRLPSTELKKQTSQKLLFSESPKNQIHSTPQPQSTSMQNYKYFHNLFATENVKSLLKDLHHTIKKTKEAEKKQK